VKRTIYIMAAITIVIAISIMGIGCAPVGLTSSEPQSTSIEGSSALPASGLGKVEVHITDAPPDEQVTSILMTLSRVEIHKAGANGVSEQEQENEQEQEQNQNQEQEQEENGSAGSPNGKQSRSNGGGKQPVEPRGVHQRVQTQEQPDSDNAGWIPLDITAPATFDLLKIKGLDELFAASQVEAGKYTQIRLTIDNVQVALGDKQAEEVKLPSGELKLVKSFNVVEGGTTEILIDFDAEKSVTVTGEGKVIVKPVVKLNVKQGSPEQPLSTEGTT
jgi:hypothetical protein